jgi:hypothetical protein
VLCVLQVHEEEWSYIPVGGPLPIKEQPLTAFGAAANLVHPATGFSVSRWVPRVRDTAGRRGGVGWGGVGWGGVAGWRGGGVAG